MVKPNIKTIENLKRLHTTFYPFINSIKTVTFSFFKRKKYGISVDAYPER